MLPTWPLLTSAFTRTDYWQHCAYPFAKDAKMGHLHLSWCQRGQPRPSLHRIGQRHESPGYRPGLYGRE